MSEFTLQYGRTSAAVTTTGAQLCSLKAADGREMIWQADPAVWAQHAPVLFPVCGTAKDNQVVVDGVRCPMTKHGFTRSAEFAVCRRGADFIDLVLGDSAETRAMYPFHFAFHVIYQLFEGGCTTSFLVENLDTRVMPFCVGGHPAFTCPMEAGAAFEDYQLVFDRPEEGRNSLAPGGGLLSGEEILPLEGGRVLPLRYALFDAKDALIFAGLNSRRVDVVHRATGRGIHFDFPKLPVLAVWTKPGAHAPYLCLEPWQGLPATAGESGVLAEKPYAICLQPGESHLTWFTVQTVEGL